MERILYQKSKVFQQTSEVSAQKPVLERLFGEGENSENKTTQPITTGLGAAAHTSRGWRVPESSREDGDSHGPEETASGTTSGQALAFSAFGLDRVGRRTSTIDWPARRVMERYMSTTRCQEGSIERIKRAKGPDVWVYRWREANEDGRRVQKKKVIGDVQRYKNKTDAKKAIQNFRAEINAREELKAQPSRIDKMTIEEAWGHFQANELCDPEINRSETTIDNYLTLFRAYIIPKWGKIALEEVKTVAVESWLHSLKKAHSEKPLAPASKAKVKSAMYSLFDHAMRHELCTLKLNPMEKVRQGSEP